MKKVLQLTALILMLCLCLAVSGSDRKYTGVVIENSDEVTEVIRNTMMHRSYSATIRFRAHTIDEDRLADLAEDMVYDAFYESDEPCGGDYLRFQYEGCGFSYTVDRNIFKNSYEMKIIPHYYTTLAQEEKTDEAVAEFLESYSSYGDLSEYDRIKAVHDHICENVRYDIVHKTNPGSRHIQSTAYGALYLKTALCQGYAVAAYRLFKELGIEARVITGKATVDGVAERHAWNIVRIGDTFYDLDITLDDVNSSDEWFLKGEKTFSVDHMRDAEYDSQEFNESYPVSEEDFQL